MGRGVRGAETCPQRWIKVCRQVVRRRLATVATGKLGKKPKRRMLNGWAHLGEHR